MISRQFSVKVDQVGPVHDRTYTYSLTIGPPNSEDVVVTCGIAKGKREAKRRCCEAMVLKVSDLPPAPPLHMQPQFQMQMRGFMRFPGGRGRFMRGRGFGPPGFRPRLPPPESEETIFKKYDRTPRGDHPSKNHPISKLCEYIRKNGWPVPQWDLINEKIIQQRKNKHGNANIMLYTFKVTIYPGKGQVEPRVYFGSGPTKKDAKFACGSVAWANIEGGVEAQAAAAASEGEARAAGANTSAAPHPAQVPDTPPVLDPKAQEYNPMQLAVSAISKMNERVRGMKNKEEWLETVNQNLEHEEKFKRFMELPKELRPPTQLIKREVKTEKGEDGKDEVKEKGEDEEAEDGEIKEERKKKRRSRWENTEEEVEVKKERLEDAETENKLDSADSKEMSGSSREKSSSSRGESSSKDRDSRSRSRKDSHRDGDQYKSADRERSRSKRDGEERSHRNEGRRDERREEKREKRRDERREERRHDDRRRDDYRHDDRRREDYRHDDRRREDYGHDDRRREDYGHDDRRREERRDYDDRESRYPPRYYDQYGGY